MKNNQYKQGTFKFGRCNVIVSIDDNCWHLSISTPTASPSYKEIKVARYKYIPNNMTMVQIFPPQEEFVNVHEFCHHLWEIKKVENTVYVDKDTKHKDEADGSSLKAFGKLQDAVDNLNHEINDKFKIKNILYWILLKLRGK